MPFILPRNTTGGTGGSYVTAGQVATFDLLPDPTIAGNEIWYVNTATGVWPINRHPSGYYRSNGISWNPWETDDTALLRINNLRAEEIAYTNGESQFSVLSNVWLALKYWFDNFFRKTTTTVNANTMVNIFSFPLANFNSGKFFITIENINKRYSLETQITVSNGILFSSNSNYTGEQDNNINIVPSISGGNIIITLTNLNLNSIVAKVTKILND